MKRLLMGLLMAAVLAGCASDPAKEQEGAAVEDRKPGTESGPVVKKPIDEGATAKPLGTAGVSADPLKDPANILSKRSVYFDFDSFLVKPEFQGLVEAHGKFLVANPNRRVVIEGNADERGSREYNLALGQKRAEAVKSRLRLLGAAEMQIETVSFGEEKPVATGSDEASWAQNRRADLNYK